MKPIESKPIAPKPSADSESHLEFDVSHEQAGARLDKTIAAATDMISRSKSEQLIDAGQVLVNGKPTKSSYKLRIGDHVSVRIPPPEVNTHLLPLEMSLDILFEDDHLLVVNKPSGLVVHPAAGHAQDTLVNALLAHDNKRTLSSGSHPLRPGIVHRLDKETSGILVIAKNDLSHERLSQQFRARTTERIYKALLLGRPKLKAGSVESHLGRHPKDRKKFASTKEEGKWSKTHYQIVSSVDPIIHYAQLRLETGRTHQIRVHMSELGLPLCGDSLYGANHLFTQVKSTKLRASLGKIVRVALHAESLAFSHPVTGERLVFKKGWPEDLRSVLLELGFLEDQL